MVGLERTHTTLRPSDRFDTSFADVTNVRHHSIELHEVLGQQVDRLFAGG
jgi:hypothetical protein